MVGETEALGAGDWRRNRILRALPESERDLVLAEVTPTEMEHGRVLPPFAVEVGPGCLDVPWWAA